MLLAVRDKFRAIRNQFVSAARVVWANATGHGWREFGVPALDPGAPLAEHRRAIKQYLRQLPFTPLYKEILEAKESSMLAWQVLALLHYFGERVEGAVLELGPYLGASTIVLAKATKDLKHPIITVEKGGSHDHPTLPSTDILGDLKRNLRSNGVAERVRLIEGNSGDSEVFNRICGALGSSNIGLLVIDSDGHVDRDIELYAPLCRDYCYLVIDDYVSVQAGEKATLIKPYIDNLVGRGKLREFGVFGWGTWIGSFRANIRDKSW